MSFYGQHCHAFQSPGCRFRCFPRLLPFLFTPWLQSPSLLHSVTWIPLFQSIPLCSLRLWSCAGEVPPRFRFRVCMLSESSRDFPATPGAVRKLKQETSFTVLLCITCYVGHGDRLCAVWGTACSRSVGALRQEKPIWTKAEDPSKSLGQSETYWRVPSPKRHLWHPVGISTLGKCPRISSSSFAPFGMQFATKWISKGGRIDSPYLVVFFPRGVSPFYSLCYPSIRNKPTLT